MGSIDMMGIFQVDVNVPAGSGRTVVNPILAEIKGIYKPGTLLTNEEYISKM